MLGFLNIKGTVLDKYQLENYMEKLASDNILRNSSDKETYPIPRMINNFDFITKVYNLLNEHLKIGINIHPAGEWLLDNYYIIEKSVKTIQKELPLRKYINFLGLENGQYKGYARIYVLAAEMVAYTENNINSEKLISMLRAYQRKKTLNMDEIWNIGIFIQIAIIENIAEICEKIYSSQMQKYRVENIIERLVESKSKDEIRYRIDGNYKSQRFGFGEMKYPFIEYMSYRLKRIGRNAYKYLDALEEQVNKMGTTISEVIKKEHFDIALRKILMGNAITGIKTLSRINFLEIFEMINGVEEILKEDPANIYDKMDYKTKEYYRNTIKDISKRTKISEIYIAQKLIELAQKSKEEKNDEKSEYRESHIGYYLISEGKEELIEELDVNIKKKNLTNDTKKRIYIYAISIISLVFSIILGKDVYSKTNIIIGIITMILLFIPITEIVVQILHYILNKCVEPKVIPKLNFFNGIPDTESTFVVIPTIIKSSSKVKELISKLEIYYLANKSENIYFALLGDCSSSKSEKEEFDDELIRVRKSGNRKAK